eukprot:jgi/Psemu1/305839/fgenesh1_kg.222_\
MDGWIGLPDCVHTALCCCAAGGGGGHGGEVDQHLFHVLIESGDATRDSMHRRVLPQI